MNWKFPFNVLEEMRKPSVLMRLQIGILAALTCGQGSLSVKGHPNWQRSRQGQKALPIFTTKASDLAAGAAGICTVLRTASLLISGHHLQTERFRKLLLYSNPDPSNPAAPPRPPNPIFMFIYTRDLGSVYKTCSITPHKTRLLSVLPDLPPGAWSAQGFLGE